MASININTKKSNSFSLKTLFLPYSLKKTPKREYFIISIVNTLFIPLTPQSYSQFFLPILSFFFWTKTETKTNTQTKILFLSLPPPQLYFPCLSQVLFPFFPIVPLTSRLSVYHGIISSYLGLFKFTSSLILSSSIKTFQNLNKQTQNSSGKEKDWRFTSQQCLSLSVIKWQQCHPPHS